ncbi:MAG: cyclic di-GMP phosphodiesterase, partial [Candidatus Hydrogenedentes bacterium]|nr:cyclic di-GMP phosphodiesterase [Candidatus Hydrogenedentota bacterium]
MGESILILDDEPPILDLLDQFLGAEGYECVQASTAAEAFTKIADRSFALLLTDLGLPDMNGLDVVRKVRGQDAEMGVIVVTGLKDVNSAVEALRAGADDYLTKPFNLREISIAVSKVLEKRALVIANRRHQQELEERVREATAGLELVNQELNKTKEYLENLLHSTVDAILTSDREGKIAFVNEGALDMLGYSRDEFLRLRAFELFARGEDEIGYLRRAVGDGKPLQHYETEFKH